MTSHSIPSMPFSPNITVKRSYSTSHEANRMNMYFCHCCVILTVASVCSKTSRASSKEHFSSRHSLSRFPVFSSSNQPEFALLIRFKTPWASSLRSNTREHITGGHDSHLKSTAECVCVLWSLPEAEWQQWRLKITNDKDRRHMLTSGLIWTRLDLCAVRSKVLNTLHP